MKKGFTLLEMMIAISVITILVLGGTMIFYKTLSSSSVNQGSVNITSSSNQVLLAIENSIRYQKVGGVDAKTRTDCLANATSGDNDSLTVYDDNGTTTYSLKNDLNGNPSIASSSGATDVFISTPNIKIISASFSWLCTPGSNDKVKVTITTNSSIPTAGLSDKTFSRDINMYNSY